VLLGGGLNVLLEITKQLSRCHFANALTTSAVAGRELILLPIHECFVYMSMILGRVRHHLPRRYTAAISRFSVFSTMSAPQPNSEPASEPYKPRYIDVFPHIDISSR